MRYAVSKAPVLSVLLLFVTLTLWSNEAGADIHADVLRLSHSERLLKAVVAPAWVVTHLLWPAHLRAHYQLREDELSLAGNPECVLSVLALVLFVGYSASAWLERRDGDGDGSEGEESSSEERPQLQPQPQPHLLLATVYFLVMLVPTAGLVQHGMVSQGCSRYAYFPSAVLVPLGGRVLGTHLFNRQSRRRGGGDRDSVSTHQKAEEEEEEEEEERTLAASSPLVGWTMFLCVLTVALVAASQQMETYKTERSLYSHNLRVDASDWRAYAFQYESSIAGPQQTCASYGDVRCRVLWELSFVFAPTRTLKAKLHRYKIRFVLGSDRDRDATCDLYDELLLAHPHNAHALNNAGVCAFRRGRFEGALTFFYQAAHSPTYYFEATSGDNERDASDAVATHRHDRSRNNVPLTNYRGVDAWLRRFRAAHGADAVPTAAERGDFPIAIMW